MNILFFLPALLLFFYCFYKFIKDDYVFIRKNVSTEQLFDLAFITLWIGLIFSRIYQMIVHPVGEQNVFLAFFSIQMQDFSLVSFFLGCTIGIFLLGKYKKLPIERFFDIFAGSFSVALPLGLLIYMFSLREYPLLINFINIILYGGFAYVVIKYLQQKFIIFSLVFLFVSLANLLAFQWLSHKISFTIDTSVLGILVVANIVLLVRQKFLKK